jgi:hypothetical protein
LPVYGDGCGGFTTRGPTDVDVSDALRSPKTREQPVRHVSKEARARTFMDVRI